MKHTITLILIYISLLGNAQTIIKSTSDDLWIMNLVGHDQVGIMHNNDAWIGGRTVYEVFWTWHWKDEILNGYKCYELTECHAWRPCDCKPIDSSYNAIRLRFNTDKKFHDSIVNDINEGIEELKKSNK